MGEEFVGRTDELRAIEALLGRTRHDRRADALLLVGEPGIGKSRLLAEAERRVGDDRILRFSGYEPESGVPLAAASPLLRRLAAASDDRTLLGLLDPGADVGGLDAIRVFESVHRQLTRLRPTALFVDDLQWADPVSVALCHFLVRAAHGAGRGFALVAASRPSPITDQFARSITAALGEDARAGTMLLGPLDRPAGIRFVTSRRSDIGGREAADLWQRAGGFPFWLDILIEARGHEGDVNEVVGERIQGLMPEAGSLLTLLAVLGRPSDPTEIVDLAGRPAERVSAALEELVLRGLVVEDRGVPRLAHDLIREVVVARTAPATVRQLHRHVATVLEGSAAGDAGGLLSVLEHRAVGGTFDADLALRILGSPQRRLIGADGVRRIAAYARGLDDRGERLRVDHAAAILAAELGDQPLALDLWRSVRSGTTDAELAARADFGASLSAYHVGRPEDARRWLDACRASGVNVPDLDIATDALEARILLWLEHRTDDGRTIALRAVDRARDVAASRPEDHRARAAHLDALIAAWEAAIQSEHVDDVLALAEESLEAAKTMGLREEIEARAMIGMALEYGADQHEATAAYRQVWDDAWRAVLPVEAVDVGYRLGSVLLDTLDLAEAARIAEETERLAARAGDQGRVRDRTRLVPYQVSMLTSDWQPGVDAILAAGADESDPHYRLRYPLAVALWFARLGIRGPEALSHADDAQRAAVAAGCVACGRDTDLGIAEVFARFGRPAEARDALARFDGVGRPSWVENEWQRRRLGILVEDAAGSSTRGRAATLGSLHDEAERDGFHLNALWIELDTGRLLADEDRAAAAAAYRRAADEARAAGAATIQRLAERGLRALGERPWKRGRAAASGGALAELSNREREVAELVAGGATNGEIATRLFLSRKTVEHHVSNALAKLGLRSRAELAAEVGRTGVRTPGQDGATPP